MSTVTTSPRLQALLQRIEDDSVGARNLFRARRMASIARQLRACADRNGFTVRSLADAMETSPSQVQRILSYSSPANVTLESIFRAADALGVEVDFQLRDSQAGSYYVQRSHFPVFREAQCISSAPSGRAVAESDPPPLAPTMYLAACGG